MGIADFGDMADLKIRLEVLAAEGDRRLVTVFGSGISNAVLPGVKELTQLFREQMPPKGLKKFDETIEPIAGTPLAYQNAAALLTFQAGEHAVMRAIRTAVLNGCSDVATQDAASLARDIERCRELTKSGVWKLPTGYVEFARFFASLDGKLRGPIITTNFDPLIEVALNEAGVPAIPIPIPVDSVPTPAQLAESQYHPVLHIHGYWTDKATSNVPSRITADRPQLDRVLRKVLRNSIVLVVGYSGWLDGFMRSLRERVLNEAELLETDVLWASYEKTPERAGNEGALDGLIGAPGFNLYLDVDGHALFSASAEQESSPSIDTSAPFGYSRLPLMGGGVNHGYSGFADGSQPTWEDAEFGRWPILATTKELRNRLDGWLERGGGGGVVAVGPLGEGKSLAIRQLALSASKERIDWQVLWREPGAPPITESWLTELQQAAKPTILCVDEADLILDQLVSTKDIWSADNSGIVFLLASHDRLWQRSAYHVESVLESVIFNGISPEDAENIATTWIQMGIAPSAPNSEPSIAMVANKLSASAGQMASKRNTLFGAMLDVRFGSQLADRVVDLLNKLRKVRLTNEVSVGDVFAGVCVLQQVLDPDGSLGRGASRPIMAAMVGLDTVFADGKILETLGREAAVAFAGNRVYSRHPAIAATVVDCIAKDDSAKKIYTLLGKAGGRLATSGAKEEVGYRDAYLLSRNLKGPEAEWAAVGAVEGAGRHLLEPRVTLLSAIRRGDSSKAVRYASGLAPELMEFSDYYGAARAFLVDFSIALREEGEAQTSAGIAALALEDRVGLTLDAVRAGYGLVSLVKSSVRINAQTDARLQDVPEVAYVLLRRIKGEEFVQKYLPAIKSELRGLEDFLEMSAPRLCGRLSHQLHEFATYSINECKLEIALEGRLSFDTLRRMAETLAH